MNFCGGVFQTVLFIKFDRAQTDLTAKMCYFYKLQIIHPLIFPLKAQDSKQCCEIWVHYENVLYASWKAVVQSQWWVGCDLHDLLLQKCFICVAIIRRFFHFSFMLWLFCMCFVVGSGLLFTWGRFPLILFTATSKS
jgi:hypothetical protein